MQANTHHKIDAAGTACGYLTAAALLLGLTKQQHTTYKSTEFTVCCIQVVLG